MTPEEETIEQALELLEAGKESGGATLTQEQCEYLLDYIDERFNDGYGCGANNVAWG